MEVQDHSSGFYLVRIVKQARPGLKSYFQDLPETPASGAATRVAVTPGISDGRMTEITGGDLKAGMLVITGQKTKTAK